MREKHVFMSFIIRLSHLFRVSVTTVFFSPLVGEDKCWKCWIFPMICKYFTQIFIWILSSEDKRVCCCVQDFHTAAETVLCSKVRIIIEMIYIYLLLVRWFLSFFPSFYLLQRGTQSELKFIFFQSAKISLSLFVYSHVVAVGLRASM